MTNDWGIKPILFEFLGIEVEAYPFFVGLGFLVAIILYAKEAKKEKMLNKKSLDIIFASIIGGAIGSKLPIWLMNYHLFFQKPFDFRILFYGKTIVGGIIGGILAVAYVKKRNKIQYKIGNQLAPSLAIGMAIGRLGCFFRGCCYGLPTNTNYGVDFGDGIHRHPTQIYEFTFDLIMFFVLLKLKKTVVEKGKLLKIFISSYFIFRFFIEFIRAEERVFYMFTAYQITTVFALILINRDFFIKRFQMTIKYS